ncbi:MAG: zinc-ribbon domain-containing protein [Deltaproteobacteria bacterium]|nr:zinc-ribbon domain-containing protein [Deltaproteobacteria bacterium]
MIIQCENCGTKFRFDETVVEEEGAWLRCSRCKTVFYKDIPIGRTAFDEPDQDDLFAGEVPLKVLEARRAAHADIERGESFKELRTGRLDEKADYFDDLEMGYDGAGDIDEADKDGISGQSRKTGRRIVKTVFYTLFMVLLLAIVAILIFPPAREAAFLGISDAQQFIRALTGGR